MKIIAVNSSEFEPEFFQVSSFQLLKLKHVHCDDLHIILSLSAVQIYDYFIYSYLYNLYWYFDSITQRSSLMLRIQA